MTIASLCALLGALGTFIAALFTVWKQARELEAGKAAQEESNRKARADAESSLNDQLAKALQSERDEFARRRQEDAEKIKRIEDKLDNCEKRHDEIAKERLKDAEDRATMRAEIAFLRGKVEGAPVVHMRALPAPDTPS